MISNMLRNYPSLFDDFYNFGITDFDRMLRSQNRTRTFPMVNTGVTDTSVEVYAFIPGVAAEDIDVKIEKNLLSIEGERKVLEAVNDDAKALRRERFSGRFKRVITLPEDVDPDSTEAVYKDGVLHITVAKREESKPRRIEVKA